MAVWYSCLLCVGVLGLGALVGNTGPDRLWRLDASVDCVCVYAHMCMHVCVYSCVGQRSMLFFFFWFYETGFLSVALGVLKLTL